MQVLLAAMLIDALHATLEDAESAFHGVCVNGRVGPVDIDMNAVKGRAVLGELATDL